MASCTTPPPTDGVARVDGRAISLAEVDARWRELNQAEQLRAQQAMYDGRRKALDAIIADQLLEKAARSHGLSLQQYLAQEMPRRTRAVTEADVESFYAENRERLQGQPIADVQAAIADLLESRRQTEARESLLAELGKAGGGTVISLEPPRQLVDVASTDPVRGPRSARVTIVEFSDYQCPFCARVTPSLAKVLATYGDRVRLVWKDFPLEDIHPRAVELARAARCAGEEGKYWEFHDRVFASQEQAATLPLDDYAKALGIQPRDFAECVKSGRHTKAVIEGQDAGNRLGVESTPTLFVNGRRITGAQPFEVLARVIDDELARGADASAPSGARESSAPSP